LWEYENDELVFNGKSKLILEEKIKPKPIEEWLKYQGRFKHLFVPKRNEEQLKRIQDHNDAQWKRYRKKYL
ncbi:MAG: pyruvate synthase subunit beta, partial [Candidatus Thermoplasmatota archaeon]|nr:pyruvate synthase subunit beta [Candidatus Thermoplasmatota archaeon]